MESLSSRWMDRIHAATKRCKDWCDEAEKAETAYKGDRKAQGDVYDFNIFHANVETIRPALYSSTASPDIRVKHGDRNDGVYETLRDVSQAMESIITAQLDDSVLDREIAESIKNMEIAGRGITRIRFSADFEEIPITDPMTGVPYLDDDGEPMVQEVMTNERVEYEAVPWRDYLEGPAKRWAEVPWVAFRLTILDEDMDQFDKAMVDAQEVEKALSKKEPDAEHTVWEIWCKASRKVYFIREAGNIVLRVDDDPLGLPDFFPIARPMEPLFVSGCREPIVPFSIYREQAEEVDRISRRINGLLKALKAKGMVIGDAADIETLVNADDCELIVAENMEGRLANGRLEDAVMWWPVDRIIQVVRELYVAREAAKQAVYEITGISDIVRGASNTNETATAQNIKAEWGTQRIRDRVRIVESHVRDLFVMTAHLIFQNFSLERMQEVSGEQFTPEMVQVIEGGLKQFAIDVESDSTTRGDIAQRREEMAAFLQGTAQYFQTMAGVVAQGGPQLAEPVIQLFASFARNGFNLGKQAEDALDALITSAKEMAQNQEPTAAEQAQQMQAQMAQADMQLRAQEQQMRAQDMMAKAQLAQQKLRLDQAKIQIDAMEKLSKDERERLKLDMDAMVAAAEIEIETDQKRGVLVDGLN